MTDPRTYAGAHTGSNPSPDGFCDDPGCGCNAESAPAIVCPGCENAEATPPMHNLEPGVCNVAIDIDRVIGSAGSYCDGCGCHLADEPHEEECDRGIDLATLRRIIGEPVEDAPLIVVTIRGGMVESIDNIPPGAVLEVRDYDVEQVDPAALVTDAEGREHSLAIHYGSGIVTRVASATDAFEAARLLAAAYDAGEESGGSMEWDDIDSARVVARRFVDANERGAAGGVS